MKNGMDLARLRSALEKYHRRKWFPTVEPDALQEWADHANEATISELVEASKQTGQRSLLAISYYIYSTMYVPKPKSLLEEYRKAYADPLVEPQVLPAFAFYHLRRHEIATEIWSAWKVWSERWEKALGDWIGVQLDEERKWNDLRIRFLESYGIETESFEQNLEHQLRSSQDLFTWQLERETQTSRLPDLLQHFRLRQWDQAADWNAFPAFGRTVAEVNGLHKLPEWRKTTQNEALQYLFPILPPEKVILEYGVASGPIDILRFLFELAKGCFYCGMNPDLPIEDRITGDPTLPLFWGYLSSCALSTKSGLNRYVSPAAESLAAPLRLWIRFWHRYDAALAIYRARMTKARLSEVQEQYSKSFHAAFSIEFPDFLYLYDLDRSENAYFRMYANSMAFLAEERLRSLFGNEWFATEACNRKFREYWRHGYRLSLKDVLTDLDVPVKLDYFLTFD